jgi:hypothetical protein
MPDLGVNEASHDDPVLDTFNDCGSAQSLPENEVVVKCPGDICQLHGGGIVALHGYDDSTDFVSLFWAAGVVNGEVVIVAELVNHP